VKALLSCSTQKCCGGRLRNEYSFIQLVSTICIIQYLSWNKKKEAATKGNTFTQCKALVSRAVLTQEHLDDKMEAAEDPSRNLINA